MANSDSSVPTQIAYNIYDTINGKQMSKLSYDDFYLLLDLIFSILTIIALVSLGLKILKLALRKKQMNNTKNTKPGKRVKIISGLVLRIILLVLIIIWPYNSCHGREF